MKVALYIGNHSKDTPWVRLGCRLTRLVQKGEYGNVTHCEAILHDYGFGVADIASSSLRDGGVRIKERVQLDPASWRIVDVSSWLVDFSRNWFEQHLGEPYDWRGAWATVMPGRPAKKGWFCDGAVGASVGVCEPKRFTTAQFAAICFTFGREVTAQFFSNT